MGVTMSCTETSQSGHQGPLQTQNRVCVQKNKQIYHERQSRELCALHTLNNLFQEKKAFTKKDLDDICVRLAPNSYINPHRSLIALGNYDVNVIMAALQSKNCDTVWFDKRRNIDSLQLSNIHGFILNVPTDFKWGYFKLPIQRKHWIAVRKINDFYYNLDSKLDAPEEIGTEAEVRSYLKEQLVSRSKELLLVIGEDVTAEMVWREEEQTAPPPHKLSSGSNTTADSGVASQSPPCGSPLHTS